MRRGTALVAFALFTEAFALRARAAEDERPRSYAQIDIRYDVVFPGLADTRFQANGVAPNGQSMSIDASGREMGYSTPWMHLPELGIGGALAVGPGYWRIGGAIAIGWALRDGNPTSDQGSHYSEPLVSVRLLVESGYALTFDRVSIFAGAGAGFGFIDVGTDLHTNVSNAASGLTSARPGVPIHLPTPSTGNSHCTKDCPVDTTNFRFALRPRVAIEYAYSKEERVGGRRNTRYGLQYVITLHGALEPLQSGLWPEVGVGLVVRFY